MRNVCGFCWQVMTSRIVVSSITLDHLDPTYVDVQRTEMKIIQVNDTVQMVDGQWVIKKDIPLNVLVQE